MTATLETFVPLARTVKGVAVEPLRLRQVPGFAAAVAPIWDLVMAENWWCIAVDHHDAAVAAITAATDVAPEALADWRLDDVFELTSAVFEVNLDFFARRLLPMAREAVARRSAQVGAPPSPPSSPEASASQSAAN